MTLETLGMSDSGSVLDTLVGFYDNRYYFVAFIVLVSAVAFPLILLSLVFTVTMFARSGRYPAFLTRLLRLYVFLEEWAMIEIFLLGIMITTMKMRHTAEIHFDPGFYCFLALVLTTMAIATVLDRERLWALLSRPGTALSVPSPAADAESPGPHRSPDRTGPLPCMPAAREAFPGRRADPLPPVRSDDPRPQARQHRPHLGPGADLDPAPHPRQRPADHAGGVPRRPRELDDP